MKKILIYTLFCFIMSCGGGIVGHIQDQVHDKKALDVAKRFAMPKYATDFKCNPFSVKVYDYYITVDDRVSATIEGCNHKAEYECMKWGDSFICSLVDVIY